MDSVATLGAADLPLICHPTANKASTVSEVHQILDRPVGTSENFDAFIELAFSSSRAINKSFQLRMVRFSGAVTSSRLDHDASRHGSDPPRHLESRQANLGNCVESVHWISTVDFLGKQSRVCIARLDAFS